MSTIEIVPVQITNLETVPKPEETIEHYICCDVPDGWVGMTKTFCGDMVFFEGRDMNTAGPMCPMCVERARYAGCPLGNQCTPVR